MPGSCWVASSSLWLGLAAAQQDANAGKAQRGQRCSQVPDNLNSHQRVRDPLALLSRIISGKSGAAAADLQAQIP